jgi:hypothetical protein
LTMTLAAPQGRDHEANWLSCPIRGLVSVS